MDYPHIPVVFDPTCYISFDDQKDIAAAYASLIIPYCKIMLLNATELKAFAPFADPEAAAVNLMLESDCEYILTSQFVRSDKSITIICIPSVAA